MDDVEAATAEGPSMGCAGAGLGGTKAIEGTDGNSGVVCGTFEAARVFGVFGAEGVASGAEVDVSELLVSGSWVRMIPLTGCVSERGLAVCLTDRESKPPTITSLTPPVQPRLQIGATFEANPSGYRVRGLYTDP